MNEEICTDTAQLSANLIIGFCERIWTVDTFLLEMHNWCNVEKIKKIYHYSDSHHVQKMDGERRVMFDDNNGSLLDFSSLPF